ncbi:Conserved_hypothetical protein [Hexamita inflata]|uniref:Uncharacterized protein n=1 Tax=Hexamita inflata TaxID=28002 RepID=A0ABP1GUP2_9EUKA
MSIIHCVNDSNEKGSFYVRLPQLEIIKRAPKCHTLHFTSTPTQQNQHVKKLDLRFYQLTPKPYFQFSSLFILNSSPSKFIDNQLDIQFCNIKLQPFTIKLIKTSFNPLPYIKSLLQITLTSSSPVHVFFDDQHIFGSDLVFVPQLPFFTIKGDQLQHINLNTAPNAFKLSNDIRFRTNIVHQKVNVEPRSFISAPITFLSQFKSIFDIQLTVQFFINEIVVFEQKHNICTQQNSYFEPLDSLFIQDGQFDQIIVLINSEHELPLLIQQIINSQISKTKNKNQRDGNCTAFAVFKHPVKGYQEATIFGGSISEAEVIQTDLKFPLFVQKQTDLMADVEYEELIQFVQWDSEFTMKDEYRILMNNLNTKNVLFQFETMKDRKMSGMEGESVKRIINKQLLWQERFRPRELTQEEIINFGQSNNQFYKAQLLAVDINCDKLQLKSILLETKFDKIFEIYIDRFGFDLELSKKYIIPHRIIINKLSQYLNQFDKELMDQYSKHFVELVNQEYNEDIFTCCYNTIVFSKNDSMVQGQLKILMDVVYCNAINNDIKLDLKQLIQNESNLELLYVQKQIKETRTLNELQEYLICVQDMTNIRKIILCVLEQFIQIVSEDLSLIPSLEMQGMQQQLIQILKKTDSQAEILKLAPNVIEISQVMCDIFVNSITQSFNKKELILALINCKADQIFILRQNLVSSQQVSKAHVEILRIVSLFNNMHKISLPSQDIASVQLFLYRYEENISNFAALLASIGHFSTHYYLDCLFVLYYTVSDLKACCFILNKKLQVLKNVPDVYFILNILQEWRSSLANLRPESKCYPIPAEPFPNFFVQNGDISIRDCFIATDEKINLLFFQKDFNALTNCFGVDNAEQAQLYFIKQIQAIPEVFRQIRSGEVGTIQSLKDALKMIKTIELDTGFPFPFKYFSEKFYFETSQKFKEQCEQYTSSIKRLPTLQENDLTDYGIQSLQKLMLESMIQVLSGFSEFQKVTILQNQLDQFKQATPCFRGLYCTLCPQFQEYNVRAITTRKFLVIQNNQYYQIRIFNTNSTEIKNIIQLMISQNSSVMITEYINNLAFISQNLVLKYIEDIEDLFQKKLINPIFFPFQVYQLADFYRQIEKDLEADVKLTLSQIYFLRETWAAPTSGRTYKAIQEKIIEFVQNENEIEEEMKFFMVVEKEDIDKKEKSNFSISSFSVII